MHVTDVSRSKFGVQVCLFDDKITEEAIIVPGHEQWSRWRAIANQLAVNMNIYGFFVEARTIRGECQLSYFNGGLGDRGPDNTK